MSTAIGERIPVQVAHAHALEVIELMKDADDRIEIAGSIRRKMPLIEGGALSPSQIEELTVGDIELVCKPTFYWKHWDEEKGEGREWTNRHMERVWELLGQGIFSKRDGVGVGEKFQGLIFKDMALDLFCQIAPAQFGVIFAMRTGPSSYNRKVFVPQRKGGLLPNYMSVSEGALHIRGRVVDTPEEKDYFDATGLPYRRPEGRE